MIGNEIGVLQTKTTYTYTYILSCPNNVTVGKKYHHYLSEGPLFTFMIHCYSVLIGSRNLHIEYIYVHRSGQVSLHAQMAALC